MAVLGVGGVFFKCKNPKATNAWYREVLGMEPNDYGGFDFLHRTSADRFEDGARSIYAVFEAESAYFAPSNEAVMINLMVDDLDALLARIKAAGVALDGEPESFDYGRFAWIMNPDGVKIELWEPVKANAAAG